MQSLHRCLGRGVRTRGEIGLDAEHACFIVREHKEEEVCAFLGRIVDSVDRRHCLNASLLFLFIYYFFFW